MKAFHKNRLLKLADFLDNLPRKQFNFGDVVEKFDEKKNCGTICCAVGWCPTVFPRQWNWITEYGDFYVRTKGSKTGDWTKDAEEFFGIGYADVTNLFFPNSEIPWARNTRLRNNATPKQVAKSIRQFLTWKEKTNSQGS